MKIPIAFRDGKQVGSLIVKPDYEEFKNRVYISSTDCIDALAGQWLVKRIFEYIKKKEEEKRDWREILEKPPEPLTPIIKAYAEKQIKESEYGTHDGHVIPVLEALNVWIELRLNPGKCKKINGNISESLQVIEFLEFLDETVRVGRIGVETKEISVIFTDDIIYYNTRQYLSWMARNGYEIPDELKDLIDIPKPEAGETQSAKERDERCIALAKLIHKENPILCKGNIARIILHTALKKMYTGEAAIKKALKGKIPGLNSGNPPKKVSDQQKKLETEIIASKQYDQ